jgi:hypothetical protein
MDQVQTFNNILQLVIVELIHKVCPRPPFLDTISAVQTCVGMLARYSRLTLEPPFACRCAAPT